MNIIKGNILGIEKGIIVHQVNTLGRMGAGLALQIRNKYPKVYDEYLDMSPMFLGSVLFTQITQDLIVASIAAQNSFGGHRRVVHTDYYALEDGIKQCVKLGSILSLEVYIPWCIGCGLANGDWEIVYSILKRLDKNNMTLVRFNYEDN